MLNRSTLFNELRLLLSFDSEWASFKAFLSYLLEWGYGDQTHRFTAIW